MRDGEAPADALRREVLEETGLAEFEIGPQVWRRAERKGREALDRGKQLGRDPALPQLTRHRCLSILDDPVDLSKGADPGRGLDRSRCVVGDGGHEHDALVTCAGIAVNVLLGLVAYGFARRRVSPLSRVVLLGFAAVFLDDLNDAYHGCFVDEVPAADTALLLSAASETAR